MSLSLESSEGALESGFEYLEKTFHSYGHIPLLSTVTGSLRVTMGIIQVIAFGILASLAYLSGHKKWAHWSATLMVKGLANSLIGGIEVVPIIGNLICRYYNRDEWLLKSVERVLLRSLDWVENRENPFTMEPA